MMSGLSRVRERGQAAVEAVALVPVLLLVVVAAWQLVAIGVAALRADEYLRREGMSGSAGGRVVCHGNEFPIQAAATRRDAVSSTAGIYPDMQADLRPCLARSRSPEYQSYFRHRPLAATIDLRARVAVPVLLPAAGDVSVVARGAVRSR